MATNGSNNVEDAEMADCDGETVLTMMDVLQEQQDFEDDANAVLGASDEKNCTYSKGYIKRQAIYACLTCCTDAKDDPTKRAGVCLACSLNCHENHDLIELYTKRSFRCDCGNPKFNSHPCQFTPDKNDLNDDNKYNQNFSGLYCNCHRPYPDPESTVEDDEMIQCIICEDWLHASHLDAVVPSVDQYAEMICKACMENNEFLHDYSNVTVNVENGDVDVIANNGDIKMSNGDLETEKLNGSEETTEKLKDAMNDYVESQAQNKSAAESGETMKNQESDQTTESKIVTIKAENSEELSLSADVNEMSKDAAITTNTSEENIKPIDDTLEDQNSERSESKETLLETVNESKAIPEATQDANDTKEPEENGKQDIPESENSEEHIKQISEKSDESFDENAENIEPTAGKESEMSILDSKALDTKLESFNENTESGDSNTAAENKVEPNITSNDIEMNDSSKESAETDNTNVAKDEDATTTKTDSTEIDKTCDEIPPETESNDNVSKIEFNETPKDVNFETDDPAVNKTPDSSEKKRKLSTEDATDDNLVKKPKLDEESKCTRPKGVKKVHKGATFWPSNFRQKLCTCGECQTMYNDLKVLFLLDVEDTVIAYETLGKERVDGRATTQYEKGLEALSSLDRTQQINALTEYNKMKDKLLDFLKNFKDRREIVKEADIKAFFAGMKPKREPDGVYFCR